MSIRRGQSGFTIIELMIATAVFAIILMVVTASILQFNRQFYKGVIASSTQNAARTLIDDLTRAIQFNGGTVSPLTGGSPQSGGFCLGGSKRYSFQLNQQVKDAPLPGVHQGYHGLVSDTVTGCNSGTTPYAVATAPANLATVSPALTNPRELLGQHMRLAKFTIDRNGDLYKITVRVVYGDDDVLCSPSTVNDCNVPTSNAGVNGNKTDLACRGSTGTAFCAVSELTTTVMKRVN